MAAIELPRSTVAAVPTFPTIPAVNGGRRIANAAHVLSGRLAAALLVTLSVFDNVHHTVDARALARVDPTAGEHRRGLQIATFVELPHFLRVGQRSSARRKAHEKRVEILDVAHQQLARVLIARSVDGLGKINDDRAVHVHQHVEVGQVAVHDSGAEHADDFSKKTRVNALRFLAGELELVEARRRSAIGPFDELHDEDAVYEMERFGHAHTGRFQAINHIDFGRAPARFFLLATVFGPFVDGALVAARANFAPFGVLRTILKAAILRFFVDFGDVVFAIARDPEHLRFFATLQRAHDLVDHALFEQRRKAIRNTHATSPRPSTGPTLYRCELLLTDGVESSVVLIATLEIRAAWRMQLGAVHGKIELERRVYILGAGRARVRHCKSGALRLVAERVGRIEWVDRCQLHTEARIVLDTFEKARVTRRPRIRPHNAVVHLHIELLPQVGIVDISDAFFPHVEVGATNRSA